MKTKFELSITISEEERDIINNEKRCKFLPNVVLPEGIECSTSYEEVINGSDFIIHVTPSKFTRNTVRQYKQYVTNQPIVICSKGFEEATLMTLDEVIVHEKELAKEIYLEAMLYHANPDDGKLDDCIEKGKYHEQIIKWLEDYKHIKQWKSDIMNDFCKYSASTFEELIANTRNKAIDDFCGKLKQDVVARTFGLRICDIHRIAEQLKADNSKKE